jgi:hypothetical protein
MSIHTSTIWSKISTLEKEYRLKLIVCLMIQPNIFGSNKSKNTNELIQGFFSFSMENNLDGIKETIMLSI